MPPVQPETVEPHHADRQPRRTNGPEADFEIIFADGAEEETLARQQANIFHEIARWQAAQQDDGTTRL
ncbi:hypothetical protein [Nocardia sp. CA-135398]|uniref:hypothetical protein n=1 Tax=Nocardia sp. CA-135398 TaxID=3239977 RepID=UPI003D9558E0